MAVYNEKNKSKWTKDGRHWYYATYYKDFDGTKKKKISKMYFSKEEALNAEALFKAKKDNISKTKFKVVAHDFFEDYKKRRKLSSYESYLYAYNKHIAPYFDDFYINDITIPNIRFWKEETDKKGLKINYCNKLYNVLKNIFDFGMKVYGLSTNPVQTMGRFESPNDVVNSDNEKIRYITLENFNKFISIVDDNMWKTFFIFLFYTGMRKGEVLALNWNDIDFERKEINVCKTLYYKHSKGEITNTKTGKNRKVKMNQLLCERLLEYKNAVIQYSDYNDKWFVFGNSRFLAPTSIDRKKNEYFDLINNELKEKGMSTIPKITVHEFRHSHVSLLVNEYIRSGGKDATKFFLMMSDRMGHTIEVMKKTYLHLFPTVQDDIINLLDNLK